MPKTRLDILLTERGLAESRSKAQAIIMSGQVRVNGQMVDKSSAVFPPEVQIEVESGPRFVSRGGEKLDAALAILPVNVSGCTCADVGASTGGFTDCLLQRGAAKVYAIDVGKGILHWKIRSDPRVVVMEETNARHVASLPEPVQLVVCDASFISLKILLPVMKGWLNPSSLFDADKGQIVTLIKPQFEAGRAEVARGEGVVRDPKIHRKVLLDVLAFAEGEGLSLRGLIRSPLLGPKGNTEFLAWLSLSGAGEPAEKLVDGVITSPLPGE